MLTKRIRITGLLATVTVLMATLPVDASAGPYHEYSKGFDTVSRQGNSYYSGVSEVRTDSVFTLTGSADCSADYVGGSNYPVYQTMWVLTDPGSADWVELGTGHKTCAATGKEVKWWYGWMCLSQPGGYCWSVFNIPVTDTASHRFFLTNSSGTNGYWQWYVDQQLEYQYPYRNIGFFDQVGLESYDANGEVHEDFYDGIVKQVNWGPWLSWQAGYGPGQPGPPSPLLWNTAPPMGGQYLDANDIYSFEGSP